MEPELILDAREIAALLYEEYGGEALEGVNLALVLAGQQRDVEIIALLSEVYAVLATRTH